MRNKAKFTKHELDIAVRVFMETSMVKNWVKSQAKLLGVDLNTPAGHEFLNREARAQAEKLIKKVD